MTVNLTNLDISTRYALQEDFDNGFVGRDRQIVIQTDDAKGYRPIIMDGKTSGGKNKVALMDDLEDWKPARATSADKLQTARTIITNLASTSTASFNGTANVTPGVQGILPVANGGTGNADGTVAKLTTARTFICNLETATVGSFNGSADVKLGVSGKLPIASGGTGRNDGHAPKDILMSGNRGSLNGYEDSSNVTSDSLTVNNTSRDSICWTYSGTMALTISNGTANKSWTKVIVMDNVNSSGKLNVTADSSKFTWITDNATSLPTKAFVGIMVVHWSNTHGFISLMFKES